MSILETLTARLPGTKNSPQAEYFFALNIDPEKLTAGLWTIIDNKLQVINSASDNYTSEEDIVNVSDRLLDAVLDSPAIEPTKILFGVQDAWLMNDDLKEPYLKLLKQLVKELELTPMAYVATSHALVHFLEKQESSPVTAILVGVGKKFVTTSLVRAGKLDGSFAIERGNNIGTDVEKGIIKIVKTDVLPARILIYGEENLDKQKSELTSFPWMSKLSFLHFPKIEILQDNLEIQSVALAGAVEFNPEVKLDAAAVIKSKTEHKSSLLTPEEVTKESADTKELISEDKKEEAADFGFVAGDVQDKIDTEEKAKQEANDILDDEGVDDENITMPVKNQAVLDEYSFDDDVLPARTNMATNAPDANINEKTSIVKKIRLPGFFGKKFILIPLVIFVLLAAAYIFIPTAKVSVYVEPRILEKETQVIADPSIKELDNEGKKIPAEIVDVQISGSGKGQATGKKQVGDPAKGVVKIINNSDKGQNFPTGTILNTPGGLKFTLDKTASISATPDDSDSKSTITVGVTAVEIGPDSNLPSGTNLTFNNYSSSQFVAKAEGNFSGGTSKDVTVITTDDQKRLLAQVTADLRKQAQEQLQGKLNQSDSGKKVLEETLTEEIVKKTYNKNINDQASEFSLDLSAKYKGTAFTEVDLRTMVAKLVETNVPENFMLNLADSETQADVAKIEKDGKVIFTARFRAKLMPKIDSNEIAKLIVGKTPQAAADIMKTYENVLGSDIIITPALPLPLQRLPFIEKNITVNVGLK